MIGFFFAFVGVDGGVRFVVVESIDPERFFGGTTLDVERDSVDANGET